MGIDVIPYEPYHPHVFYTLLVTCCAWVVIYRFCHRSLHHAPRQRVLLYALAIVLPFWAEGGSYVINVLRPAPDTPLGYVLTHTHTYVINRIPIDSFFSLTTMYSALLLFAAALAASLGRYGYAMVQLRKHLVGAAPLDADQHPGLHKRLLAIAAREGWVPPQILVVPDHKPQAFVTGLVQPQIYVSRGLLHLLNEDEALGVVCHEWAHVLRRDTLLNVLVHVFHDMLLFLPWGHLAWRNLVISQDEACDRLSAWLTKQPLALARALVKVSGAQATNRPRGYLPATPFTMNTSALAVRVENMVELRNGTLVPKPPVWRSVALAAGLMIVAVLPTLLGS